MPNHSLDDLATLERTSQSPQTLCDPLSGVLSHSVFAKVKVESCDHGTGQYRVVLRGTLDTTEPDFTIGS